MYFIKSKYKISLEIESKSSMYTSVIRYLATYPNINKFLSKKIINIINKNIDDELMSFYNYKIEI